MNALMGHARCCKSERCCGESGTLRGDAARHRHAGALPQGGGDAQAAPRALRADGFARRGQDPDLLPVAACRACRATTTTRGTRGRLHRRRDGAATCSARTGCRTTSRAPTPAASSACWSERARGRSRPAEVQR
ncbi:MAG: hypothetical protein MZW92_78390 [Comamonadaceae bacterium]|nr:hypothetical protein [Comamonadaceae bacterium]